MNILTVALFAILVFLSLNPEVKETIKQKNDQPAVEKIQQQAAQTGMEKIISNAADNLRDKHLR